MHMNLLWNLAHKLCHGLNKRLKLKTEKSTKNMKQPNYLAIYRSADCLIAARKFQKYAVYSWKCLNNKSYEYSQINEHVNTWSERSHASNAPHHRKTCTNSREALLHPANMRCLKSKKCTENGTERYDATSYQWTVRQIVEMQFYPIQKLSVGINQSDLFIRYTYIYVYFYLMRL